MFLRKTDPASSVTLLQCKGGESLATVSFTLKSGTEGDARARRVPIYPFGNQYKIGVYPDLRLGIKVVSHTDETIGVVVFLLVKSTTFNICLTPGGANVCRLSNMRSSHYLEVEARDQILIDSFYLAVKPPDGERHEIATPNAPLTIEQFDPNLGIVVDSSLATGLGIACMWGQGAKGSPLGRYNPYTQSSPRTDFFFVRR